MSTAVRRKLRESKQEGGESGGERGRAGERGGEGGRSNTAKYWSGDSELTSASDRGQFD